jgi:hypothetical protein
MSLKHDKGIMVAGAADFSTKKTKSHSFSRAVVLICKEGIITFSGQQMFHLCHPE